jgi:hypothetical protein
LEDEMKKGTVKAKYFPVFRYAETLLNYVEAINELKEPYTMEMPNGSQEKSSGQYILRHPDNHRKIAVRWLYYKPSTEIKSL